MNSKRSSYHLLATLIAFTLLGQACKNNNDTNIAPTAPVVVTGLQLTSNSKLGNVITDNAGRSVYFFSKDAAATSVCVDACAVKWPPFYKAISGSP